jgi:Asp-tRNA(Asn)/Glu-tRNA(Gln) amidotransferase A subunit family amidase
MDTSGYNQTYGSPINPYNKLYYTGGSSSGSASAVAAGILPFTLGCDGGGSIRLPSSWCGIYGLKTSHGWVSSRPYESRAKSTAVSGPMAANMVDLEVAWRVMSQPDPDDATSRQFPMPARLGNTYPKRIGIYKTWFNRADPVVRSTCQKAVDYFKSELGYEIIDITIPHLKEAQMAHALTILNEATSGVKKSDLKKLTPPNQILLTVGHVASCAEFLAAQRIRTMVMEHLAFLFKKYPGLLIVHPTTPNAGWPIHKKDKKYGTCDGNRSIRNMEYVWLANFSGIPCISVPVGYVDPVQGNGKVPVGLSAAGEWGSEDHLIEFGYEGERFLNNVYEGGRLKPKHFVDVLGLVGIGKHEHKEEAKERSEEDSKEVKIVEKMKIVNGETIIVAEKASEEKVVDKEEIAIEGTATEEQLATKEVENVDGKIVSELNATT